MAALFIGFFCTVMTRDVQTSTPCYAGTIDPLRVCVGVCLCRTVLETAKEDEARAGLYCVLDADR